MAKIKKHSRVRKIIQHIFDFDDRSRVIICPPDEPTFTGDWKFYGLGKFYHGTLYADRADRYTLIDIDGLYFPPQLITALAQLHYDISELELN